ncbi:MAG TPA: S1/P1 nuclease [Desulfosarcina sp.]|nr:S1/P1 nuclease [Desulfosarcina sp.]
MRSVTLWLLVLCCGMLPCRGWGWHDETHLAIAKSAGYAKWYNAAGPDMAKIKAGDVEHKNHYANNPPWTEITARMVLDQAQHYNSRRDKKGHLYGAIVAAVREYRAAAKNTKYTEYHLAFCAHYVGDLSQPLHNTAYNDYNKRHHSATDAVIEDEVLANLPLIERYPVLIRSETELAEAIARVANLSMQLGYRLEREGRMLSRQEAYVQVGHSASLLRGILDYVRR